MVLMYLAWIATALLVINFKVFNKIWAWEKEAPGGTREDTAIIASIILIGNSIVVFLTCCYYILPPCGGC
jgi:hypothetical protein